MRKFNLLKFSGIIIAFIVILLGLITTSNNQKIASSWSEPETFYVRSDTNQTNLRLIVHEGDFDIIARHFRLFPPGSTVGDSIDFTRIEYIQINHQGNNTEHLLTDETYPSSLISINKDNNGKPYFFWAERRIDLEFDLWILERPRIARFSNTIFTSFGIGENILSETVELFSDDLDRFGMGPIGLPVQSSFDSSNILNIVFLTTASEQIQTVNGGEVFEGQGVTAYANTPPGKEWEDVIFLDVGHTPDITVLPNGRIVVAGFGSVPDQQSTNDIFITYSDDGGKSWSEKKLVFLSGSDPGVLLRLESTPDGTLHLLWARSREGTLLVPEEMWHMYSADGGESWSDPVKFFEIEATSEFPLHHFSDFDSLVDKFGNLHWTTSTLKRNSSMGISERTLFYSSFNPVRERWEQISVIGDTDFPGGSQLEADNVTDELYLIWNDRLNDDLWKVWKYIKKPIREPDPTPDLPVVAESGPLQMHPNYPNPFNNSTNISFTLLEPGEVELSIYDMSGRRVISQDLGNRSPGRYDHSLQMEGMPSGAYIYNIVVDGTYSQQSQMVLVK